MIPYNQPTVVLNSAQMMINGNATIIWRSHIGYSDGVVKKVDVYELWALRFWVDMQAPGHFQCFCEVTDSEFTSCTCVKIPRDLSASADRAIIHVDSAGLFSATTQSYLPWAQV